jgi:amino acid adenylation domain-containing protein
VKTSGAGTALDTPSHGVPSAGSPERAADFWSRRLAGGPGILELPSDRSPAAGRGWQRERHRFRLPDAATDGHVTLAAFAALLHRLSGQDDVWIAHRAGPGAQLLPLRLDLGDDPTFEALVDRVRRAAAEAEANRAPDLPRILAELRAEWGTGDEPPFHALVQFGDGDADPEAPVALLLAGRDARLTYDAERFASAAVERLAGQLATLLQAAAASPATRVRALPLLTGAERGDLLGAWRGPSVEYPRAACLHELIEAQVERTPAATALVFEDGRLTYAELNERANRLAHRLRRLGVGPEVPVGLLLAPSLDLVVGIVAALKAGGLAVPLNPALPPANLAFVVEDARVPLVLAGPGLPAVPGCRTVDLDGLRPDLAAEPAENPAGVARPGNGCYVFYTSGSTGTPKGIAVSHSALVFMVAGCLGDRYRPGESVALAVPVSFGASFMVLFPCLASGGRLHVLSRERLLDAQALADYLERNAVDHLTVTPAHLAALLTASAPDRLLPRRSVQFGAGTIRSEWLERLRAEAPGRRFINVLGANEAMMICQYRPEAGEPLERALVPVGRPAPNAQVYVLDSELGPLPPGVAGELYVASAGVVDGYLRRPGLTAEKFLPDPFADRPGGRMYRTGDLVRFLPDGNFEYVGRIDGMVKLRGYRIEPGEVESVLARHPAVAEAAVQVRSGGAGQRLVGYVVERPGRRAGDAELREYLLAYLPAYMAPAAWVRLDALPLNANGKVDYRALPDPEPARPELATPYTAARDDVERELATLWTELLDVDRVGVRDDFFELGGDSLVATRMVAEAERRFGVRIGISRLLGAATVANLAAVIRAAEAPPAPGPAPAAPAGGTIAARELPFLPFPMTELQEAYWVGRRGGVELGDVGAHRYMEFETGDLDLARLEAAWRALIDRHDMLRMVVRSDGLQQVLRRVPGYRIEVDDLRDLDPAAAETALLATRERMAHDELDPGRWPLFELRASRLTDEGWRLHLSLDLLVADVLSFQILVRELASLYERPDVELDPLDLTFRDYVLAELAGRDSEEYRRAREYWRRRVEVLPPAPELPAEQGARLAGPLRFERRSGVMEPGPWERFKRGAARAGLTPSGALLAAFAEVLRTWSRSPRFTIVLTTFNRRPLHPQVDRVVGEFTSTVLLGVEAPEPGEPLQRRARRLQEQLWLDLDHGQVSGVTVLRDLVRARGGALRAAVPVVFTSTLGHADPDQPIPEAIVGAGLGPDAVLPVLGRVVHSLHQAPQTLLNLHAFDRYGGIVFGLDAAESLFPGGMAADLFEAFSGLLDRLAADEDTWRQARPRLVPERQLETRRRVNGTDGPVSDGLLHTLLAEAGERPAVVAGDVSLTYAELHARSGALAGRLAELGARPGDLVGVVMTKGWEQVVAALGVLAVGCAYVPLDAGLPTDRVQLLLQRTGARIAVTQDRLAAELRARHPETAWLTLSGGGSAGPLPNGVDPDDLAYVIHTSGSTGAPKGVMITHRAAVNTILDVNRRFGIGPEDRVLAVSALDFDLSVWDLFGTLAGGGAIVIPEAGNRDPAHWARLLADEGVTVWNSVPAMMQMLVEYLGPRGAGPHGPLRLALLSGDWIPVGLPDQVRRCFPDAEVVSLGGATEAGIWSVAYPIAHVDPAWRSIPYGRPLTNQRAYVLDEGYEPRPDWVTGSLYLAGLGLARGYWRDRARTDEAFVVSPDGGERLYRTGDLARFLPDGNLELIGREDLQVKLRGYRIEPGEIEAALEAHPGVQRAVVAVRRDGPGEPRLVAYTAGPGPDAGELERHLRDRLPAYMVPAAFVALAELPLTANGKVDRGALPAPPAAPAGTGGASPEELAAAERVAAVAARVLGLDRVEAGANLFDLGATSIDIVRIANLMEEELGYRPELEALMVDPAILDVARAYLAQGTRD